MSSQSPEASIRQGVDRYQAVIQAQREEAERIRREREEADQQAAETSPGEEVNR